MGIGDLLSGDDGDDRPAEQIERETHSEASGAGGGEVDPVGERPIAGVAGVSEPGAGVGLASGDTDGEARRRDGVANDDSDEQAQNG